MPGDHEGVTLAGGGDGRAVELHHLPLRARVRENAKHASGSERRDPVLAGRDGHGVLADGEGDGPVTLMRPGLVGAVEEDGRTAALLGGRGERAAPLTQATDGVPVVVGDGGDTTAAAGVVEGHLDRVEITAGLTGAHHGANHVVAEETAARAVRVVTGIVPGSLGGNRPDLERRLRRGRGGDGGTLAALGEFLLHPLPSLELGVVRLLVHVTHTFLILGRDDIIAVHLAVHGSREGREGLLGLEKVELRGINLHGGSGETGGGHGVLPQGPLPVTVHERHRVASLAPARAAHGGLVLEEVDDLLLLDVPYAHGVILGGGEQVLAVGGPLREHDVLAVALALASVLGDEPVVLEFGPRTAREEGDVVLTAWHREHGAIRPPARAVHLARVRLGDGRDGGGEDDLASLRGRVLGVVIPVVGHVRVVVVTCGDRLERPHGEDAGVVNRGEKISLGIEGEGLDALGPGGEVEGHRLVVHLDHLHRVVLATRGEEGAIGAPRQRANGEGEAHHVGFKLAPDADEPRARSSPSNRKPGT